MTDHYEPRRFDFIEQVAKLAGKTTFREPIGGYGTRRDYMPTEHAIAAAMAYARRGQHDIGPDIAVAIATGCTDHRMEIVRELAAALLAGMGKVADRNADYLLEISADSYLCVIGIDRSNRPVGVSEKDYQVLRYFGDRMLLDAAEAALRRAARAWRKAA